MNTLDPNMNMDDPPDMNQWIQDGYSMLWMEEEEYRDSEVEVDSDHEDTSYDGHHVQYTDEHGGTWLGHHMTFNTDLDSSETGTVRRRAKTIVTPKMAMESFRLSFLNDDQDINFDTILGELSELENQLTTTQSELCQSLGVGGQMTRCSPLDSRGEGGDTIQAELDALAAEITQGLSYNYVYKTTNGQLHIPVITEHNCDAGETDSAFSDNTSLPSSESFTSMATVSSSAETTSSSSGGETCSMSSAVSTTTVQSEEEHLARMKAEKIRIALEKIKEAKIRKLFVRAFATDGSSKSILVDEKMTVGQVCSMLADKHHGRLTHAMAVIEHMPELFMERVLEDHDSLVENMVMWTRDSKNKVLFEERREKYNLFFSPEKYLLSGTAHKGIELGSTQKERLIQEFFSPAGVSVPEVEGALYLKSDGKKAWKKYFFVLRASGLYYNPKGKVSKAPKDLVCLVQFEFVEVYHGLGWKKKYHSPTDFCFALKHPQIQKKTSKYIRYFCAESETTLDQWIMGIRIAKLGKQLLHNFEHVHHEISTWDLRQTAPTPANSTARVSTAPGQQPDTYQALNQSTLQDSRLSVPEPSSHHTIVTVHSTSLVRNSAALGSDCPNPREAVAVDGTPISHRKGSEGGGEVSTGHKTPTKRVSFSTTHCIITDSSEQLVVAKHRDSIVSASTDSSEDSNSSGESRHIMANTLRGKLRPKLPVTTETTRQLTEMNQLSFDSGSPSGDGYGLDETSSLSSASSTSSRQHFSRGERRRSSMTDRRGSSDTGTGRCCPSRMNGCGGGMPMSPPTSSRRYSHEGSPVPMSPVSRHSTQHWVDECQGGMEAMASVPEVSQPGYCSAEDQYMYSGGMSHYQQIPHYKQHPLQQQQQQHQQQQYQRQYSVDSGLYATIGHKAPHQGPLLQPVCPIENGYYGLPPQAPDVAVQDLLPPPPQFQEHLASPPLGSQKVSPPTAPKPSGPAPPPPTTPKQQQPPPVLPKSSPAQPGGVVYGTPGQGGTCRGAGETQSLGRSKPAVPPPQPGQPPVPAGKVPPPTLPKSSGPMSPVNGPAQHRLGRGVSPVSPVSPACTSAPATMTKSVPIPTGHAVTSWDGHTLGQGDSGEVGPVSSGSPHRVSHIKHPSTGSPMLGMGQSPPSNKGPTPSDSGYIEGDGSSCSGSPRDLPYLGELSRRSQGPAMGTSPPKPSVQAPETSSQHGSANHRRSASAGSTIVKGGNKQDSRMKAPPPPPPKRSDTTRLSTELSKSGTPPSSPQPQTNMQGPPQLSQDPIYENFEGILDINELPPPPPELLAGLAENPSSANTNTAPHNTNSKKQQRLPPPPPKRNKDTHLSH